MPIPNAMAAKLNKHGEVDHYALLDITQDANDTVIKQAYRKLAKELHPDKNRDDPNAGAHAVEQSPRVTSAPPLS